MATLNLISSLSTIVSRMNTDAFGFYYGELGWQNLTNEDTTFPLVSVDFIRKVTFDLVAGGRIKEGYPVTVYFGYKSELDWTTLEHEAVIESARLGARNFLSNLQNYKDADGNKIVDEIKIINADRVILRPSDDVGTSGILLQLNIVPNVTAGVCI